jgi:hypothetical protein
LFSLCSQVRGVRKWFSNLLFSITSQVWEDTLAMDIMSLQVLHDGGLLTSHEQTQIPCRRSAAISAAPVPAGSRRDGPDQDNTGPDQDGACPG